MCRLSLLNPEGKSCYTADVLSRQTMQSGTTHFHCACHISTAQDASGGSIFDWFARKGNEQGTYPSARLKNHYFDRKRNGPPIFNTGYVRRWVPPSANLRNMDFFPPRVYVMFMNFTDRPGIAQPPWVIEYNGLVRGISCYLEIREILRCLRSGVGAIVVRVDHLSAKTVVSYIGVSEKYRQ
jgi:hypothetical protein